MRVACPECSAAYDLPPALAARLDEGRPLRCARCGHTWKPEAPAGGTATNPMPPGAAPLPPASLPGSPPSGTAEPEAPAAPPAKIPAGGPPPAPEPAMPRPVTPARILAAAWAVSFLLLAGLATAAWNWRIDLVEAWPPAARAFMALGLAG